MPIPRAQRTPQPGGAIPGGSALEKLFQQYAGEPDSIKEAPPMPPEVLLKLMKEGRIKELFQGRYGLVAGPEELREEAERGQVESNPKMRGLGGDIQGYPGEPLDSFRAYRQRWHPTATPTPTPYHQPPPYWFLPTWLRMFLMNNFPEGKTVDRYANMLTVPYTPITAGGRK